MSNNMEQFNRLSTVPLMNPEQIYDDWEDQEVDAIYSDYFREAHY